MARACCPTCRKPLPEGDGAGATSAGSAFPFCSPRCKLADLGAWLDGKYRIAGEPISEGIDDEVLSRLTSRDGGDA